MDPLAFKRETALKLGATHAFASAEEAAATVAELTWGQMADQAPVRAWLALAWPRTALWSRWASEQSVRSPHR